MRMREVGKSDHEEKSRNMIQKQKKDNTLKNNISEGL